MCPTNKEDQFNCNLPVHTYLEVNPVELQGACSPLRVYKKLPLNKVGLSANRDRTGRYTAPLASPRGEGNSLRRAVAASEAHFSTGRDSDSKGLRGETLEGSRGQKPPADSFSLSSFSRSALLEAAAGFQRRSPQRPGPDHKPPALFAFS